MQNTHDNADICVKRKNLEADYYRKRWEFRNKVERFYRQTVYGTYVSEDNLIHLLEELNDLRSQIKEVDEEIIASNRTLLSYSGVAWNNHSLFDGVAIRPYI